jgi:hypothetical protein
MPSEVFHATCLHVWMFFGSELVLTYSHRLFIFHLQTHLILKGIYALSCPLKIVLPSFLSWQNIKLVRCIVDNVIHC